MPARDGFVPLGEAIKALRSELLQAMADASDEELRFALGPVELEFKLTTTTEASAGGGVRFWLINADAKGARAHEDAHTLRVTLTPVHASQVKDGGADVLVTSELRRRDDGEDASAGQ
jgi:Trypsin-co-occurring domain 2